MIVNSQEKLSDEEKLEGLSGAAYAAEGFSTVPVAAVIAANDVAVEPNPHIAEPFRSILNGVCK